MKNTQGMDGLVQFVPVEVEATTIVSISSYVSPTMPQPKLALLRDNAGFIMRSFM